MAKARTKVTFTERSAGPAIERAPRTASEQQYDLVVIGGGIHGACVALEATQRGARVLLVEQADFGGATSHNSHRVIHGGLRYLQSLDLSRVAESIRCRQWFLDHFPELVRPLPCLMPLYGVGLRRPSAFRAALAVHRGLARLSGARIDGPDRGRVLDTGEVLSWAPHLQSSSLRGGGLWYDAVMVNPARLLMELLRWACDGGATVLNYVEAVALERRGDRIDGVVAVDRVTQETMVFRTKKVVNCAGPWTRRLAAEFDQDIPSMGTLALAFGMLVDRKAPSSAALAVTANSNTKATCFLVPWGDRLCVGTHNAKWSGPLDKVTVSESELGDLMAAVNGALPRLELGRSQILRVYSGLVPTLHQDAVTPADRPVVIDHEAYGGPSGLVSLIGVKYTTAPAVARRAVTAALGNAGRRERKWSPRPRTRDEVARLDLNSADAMLRSPSDRTRSGLRALTDDEAVIHLDDLVLRRSDWGQSRSEGMDVGERATALLGWPAERRDAELKRLEAALETAPLGQD